MQEVFDEELCEYRTPEKHSEDLMQLQNLPPSKNNYRGIKFDTPFNDLRHFQSTNNWVNDIMHSAFQGAIPYVTSAVFHNLIHDDFVTMQHINEKINWLFSILVVDRKSKPLEIKGIETSGVFCPSMSAAQIWALFRYLPLMIHTSVPHDSPHWSLFFMLQEVIDILVGPLIMKLF